MAGNQQTIGNHPAFQELLETEKSYQQNLQIVIDAVKKMQQPIPKSLETLEQIILALRNISETLLENLETTQRVLQTQPQEGLIELRIKRLETLNQFFDLYKQYARIHPNYEKEVKSNPEKFTAIKAEIKSLDKSKTLSSCLISPIQRGPRYTLLLEVLKKDEDNLGQETKEHLQQLEVKLKQNLDAANAALKKKPDSPILGISLQVLGGFAAVLGAGAIAAGIILLVAATGGAAAWISLGAGTAALAGGLGLFATGAVVKPSTNSPAGNLNPAL